LGRINPLIGIGLPSWGKVSITWSRAYRHLGGPLGSTCVELEPVIGEPIAQARNKLMAMAIAAGCEFLYMHGDDVLAPANMLTAMLKRFREHPDIDLLTGVYWTREWPTSPYLWRGMQRGPFYDWKVGEFLTVDYAGCDALMIRLSDRVKEMGPDWFATDWLWTEDQERPSEIATEDFYFYTKARRAGIRLWCDTSLQCIHEDRNSGMQFGLTSEMPQAGGVLQILPEPADGPLVKVADIGCGGDSPFFGQADAVVVTRIDLDESKRPDIRADIRDIPVPDGSFDVVHSRHALEHFGRAEIVALLTEWVRILRIGGELRINVPNLKYAIEQILKQDAGEIEPHPYAWWQLYGQQTDERDVHKNGYTARRLRLLLEMPCFGLDDVTVEEVHDGQNLQATATKARALERYALTPEWDAIAQREGIVVPGLAPIADPAPSSAVAPMPAPAFTTKDAVDRINGQHRLSESVAPVPAADPPPRARRRFPRSAAPPTPEIQAPTPVEAD
jgi:predicted SAM-dependent methyltransferase